MDPQVNGLFSKKKMGSFSTSCRDDNAIKALVYKSLEFSYLSSVCLRGFSSIYVSKPFGRADKNYGEVFVLG
jgi:hypothetical protein